MITKRILPVPDEAQHLPGSAEHVATHRGGQSGSHHLFDAGGGRRRLRTRVLIGLFRMAIVVLALCASVQPAAAACSGSSPNRTAASAQRQDVLDCVNAAASGDTIRVPAGSGGSWSTIALPVKDLEIIGATVINCTGGSSSSSPVTCAAPVTPTTISCGTCFTINLQSTQRISGFVMNNLDDLGGIAFAGGGSTTKHFRVDHNKLTAANGEWARFWIGANGPTGSSAVHAQGIFDHNIITDISLTGVGNKHQWDESCGACQHQLWAQTTTLGDSTGVVYIEANHFQHTSGNTNSTDSNYGSRQVIRFNNVTGGRHTHEIHGMQGDNRGPMRTEIYQNAASNLTGFSGTAFFRGGAGVLFGNRQSAGFSFGILFTNDRSELDDSIPVVGNCDGSHSGVDQNTSGQRGWRCRDQVGIIGDNSQWQATSGAWNQRIAPVYVWENFTGGSAMSVDVDSAGDVDLHIQANRDFYNQSASFNGSSGVGVGPIGSRPSSCTTGVAYWANNEGEWNSLQAGADGRLYKCTATNTWTLYFTPYPYPHPWTGGTTPGPVAPEPPSQLRITTTSAALLLLLPGIGLCFLGRRTIRRD